MPERPVLWQDLVVRQKKKENLKSPGNIVTSSYNSTSQPSKLLKDRGFNFRCTFLPKTWFALRISIYRYNCTYLFRKKNVGSDPVKHMCYRTFELVHVVRSSVYGW